MKIDWDEPFTNDSIDEMLDEFVRWVEQTDGMGTTVIIMEHFIGKFCRNLNQKSRSFWDEDPEVAKGIMEAIILIVEETVESLKSGSLRDLLRD